MCYCGVLKTLKVVIDFLCKLCYNKKVTFYESEAITMKPNVLRQPNSDQILGTRKVYAAIGRFMLLHLGHQEFLIEAAKECDELIVFLGSCNQLGDEKYPLDVTIREKTINAIMKEAGIPEGKWKIVPIPDLPTFEEWWDEIETACQKNGVTHFITGNKEDILSILEEKDEPLGMELINPEMNSTFPYHASDLRKMKK